MANLALNRPRRSRFASLLQLFFEPILLAAHLLAQPNYGDNTSSVIMISRNFGKAFFCIASPLLVTLKVPRQAFL
jgi:hypothetical protein